MEAVWRAQAGKKQTPKGGMDWKQHETGQTVYRTSQTTTNNGYSLRALRAATPPSTLVRRKSVDTITDLANNSMLRGRPGMRCRRRRSVSRRVMIRAKSAMVRKVDGWTAAIVRG